MHSLAPTLLVLTVTLAGCAGDAQPVDDYAPWVRDDPDRWPRIAMVNRIRYTDSNHPMAGSAFLIDTGNGIVAATAKHVLRYFKSEAMDSVAFGGTLVRWEMFPKDEPTDVTVVGALINEDANEPLEDIRAARDWLLFGVARPSRSVTPLRLRTTPLKAGEAVSVLGWRYTDEGRQHVYRGSYVRSEKGSVLIDVAELADNTIPGLSGAPVIDARGYVIGTMSSKAGKLQRLASIDYARTVLESYIPTDPAADCAKRMAEHFRQRGWIGITPEVDATGVVTVAEVFDDSPADQGGMRRGDIIRGTDDAAFRSAYDSLRPGTEIVFELERDGERLAVEVLVEPIPEAILKQWIDQECP